MSSEDEVDDEKHGEHVERGIELPTLPGAELHDDIAEYAEADAVGNAVAEHHGDHGNEGREGIADVVHVDFLDRVQHENAHHDQRAAGGGTGNEQEDRGEEEAEKEKHSHDEGGDTLTSALGDA